MKFDDWFAAQFGPEPHPKSSLNDLWNEADHFRRLLRIAEQKVKDREQWIDRRKAALYAWQIGEKEKK